MHSVMNVNFRVVNKHMNMIIHKTPSNDLNGVPRKSLPHRVNKIQPMLIVLENQHIAGTFKNNMVKTGRRNLASTSGHFKPL